MDAGGFEIEPHRRNEPRQPDAALVRPQRPRIWTVFVGYLALWLGAMGSVSAVAALIVIVRGGGDATSMQEQLVRLASEPAFLLVSSLTTSLWCAGIAALSVWAGDGSARARLRTGRAVSSAPARLYALLVLCGLAVSQIASSLIVLAGADEIGTLSELGRSVAALPPPLFAAALLVLGVAAPVGEELFFRGFVQTRLTARWGAQTAIVVTAALFGLLHGDPVHSLAALLIGVILGWMVELTGSIRPAVAAHVVNNLIWVMCLKLPPGELGDAAHSGILAGCGATAFGCIVLARRYSRR